MNEKLEKIMQDALGQINSSENLEKLNDIKVAFLGKKGELTSVLKSMKDVAPEDRPKVGQMVNDARQKIEKTLEEKQKAFAKKCYEILSSFLSDTRNYKADNNNSSDLLNDLINQYSNIPEDEPKDKKKKKIDLEEENER